ncbi:MAG: hypothetical protein WBA39_25450 [Rivularia sp. (in: cyanobacteria)]
MREEFDIYDLKLEYKIFAFNFSSPIAIAKGASIIICSIKI